MDNIRDQIIQKIRRNRISSTQVADCLEKTGAIEGVTPLERPIQVLYRKGKQLSPLSRRFLAFAHDHVARAGHPAQPRLVALDKQTDGEASQTLI